MGSRIPRQGSGQSIELSAEVGGIVTVRLAHVIGIQQLLQAPFYLISAPPAEEVGDCEL